MKSLFLIIATLLAVAPLNAKGGGHGKAASHKATVTHAAPHTSVIGAAKAKLLSVLHHKKK